MCYDIFISCGKPVMEEFCEIEKRSSVREKTEEHLCVNGAAAPFCKKGWELCAAQSHHPAVDVAPDKIAYNQAGVEDDYFHPVLLGVLERHGQIIECIGYAVRKSADDEQRYAEKQR